MCAGYNQVKRFTGRCGLIPPDDSNNLNAGSTHTSASGDTHISAGMESHVENSKGNHNKQDDRYPPSSLEDIVEAYLNDLADDGIEDPSPEKLIEAYPHHAEALRGIFRTLDFIQAAGQSLNASKLSQGYKLGDFKIIREIGRGGMGVVYEAVQQSLNRRVALKVLPTAALLSDKAAERFMREASTAGKLHHTNIVPVYAIGEESGIRYYAMQYIEGKTLSEFLKGIADTKINLQPEYFKRVARWAKQTADALAYAHLHGVIHRDIKPTNLLLDAEDHVWISDFGLARINSQVTITGSGELIGTARYMAPEQVTGSVIRPDHRADIYSLGATLYELVAMQPAIAGETREDVLNRITISDPVPIKQINPAIPRNLETIITKCMDKVPERRYQLTTELADDLHRFLTDKPIFAKRTPLIKKLYHTAGKYRTRIATVFTLLLLIIISSSLYLKNRHDRGQAKLDAAFHELLYIQNSVNTEQLLDEAENLGMDTGQLYLCRGLVPLFNRQPQRAIEPLNKALQSEPDNVEICFALAYAYYAVGDTLEGDRHFSRGDIGSITTAMGWLLRGYACTEAHKPDALQCFTKALNLRSDLTSAISARARYRSDLLVVDGDGSQLTPLLEDYNAWVRLWPNSWRAYTARAGGLFFAVAYASTQPDMKNQAEQWFNNAVNDLDTAAALPDADPIHILTMQGTLERYTGDFAASAQSFAKAIELDFESSGNIHEGMVHHRVLALQAMGEIDTALKEITPAAQSLPNFFILPVQQAILLAEQNRIGEAQSIIKDMLQRQWVDPQAFLVVLAVCELLNIPEQNWKPAYYKMTRSTKDLPANSSFNDNQNVLHGKILITPTIDYLQNRLTSDQLYESAASHPGTRCEYAFLIALHELKLGNRNAAKTALRTCMGTGVTSYIPYRLAQVFTARMDSDSEWPAWIN